jgi:hypothetical protein
MFPLLALASALAAPACNTQSQAQRVHTTQSKLFAIPEVTDDLPIDAPSAAQTGVPALRVALSDAITGYMQCDAANTIDTATIQSAVANLLNANQPVSTDERKRGYPDHTYGSDLTIHVAPFQGRENSIAIDTSFSIGCGQDHVLLLFDRESNHWLRVLDWHSDKYTKPSDAFGDFFLYTSAPGANGTKLVAVAHGHPWCISRMSYFDVDLLQPATAQVPQHPIGSTHSDYSRGDTTPTLKSYSEGVTLRLDASSRDFDNVFTYIGVFRYKTTANALDRLPVANNARNFVDSWLDASWPVAARWSAEPSTSLQTIYNHFDYSTTKDVPNIMYGPVRACSEAGKFQVEMDIDDMHHDDLHLFAQVRENSDSFTMLGITSNPNPTCTGPNLIPKRR